MSLGGFFTEDINQKVKCLNVLLIGGQGITMDVISHVLFVWEPMFNSGIPD